MKKTKTPKDEYGVKLEYKGKEWMFFHRIRSRMENPKCKRSDKSVYEAIDIDQRTFSDYKNGKTFPPSSVLFKLARELDCSADYLMGLDNATDHECSDISEKIGLSGETVEILREAVKKGSNKYKLLIDLFEFLLQHYISYEFDLSELQRGGQISIDTFLMYDRIIRALMSTQALKQCLPDDEEYSNYQLKRHEAQVLLSEHGDAVISAENARDYYLREAADKFRELLLPFCMKMTEEDPNYVFKAQGIKEDYLEVSEKTKKNGNV